MVVLGVFFLALGMLVQLLSEQADEDDPQGEHGARFGSDPKTPALVRASGRRQKRSRLQ
jgi:hypothetical protein